MNIKLEKAMEIIFKPSEITGPIRSKIYHKVQNSRLNCKQLKVHNETERKRFFTLAADILCLAVIFDTAVFIAFMTMTRSPGSNCLESVA